MRRRSRTVLAALTAIVCATGVAGCGKESAKPNPSPSPSAAPTPAGDFAVALKGRVTTDAMLAHLKKLQEIADANRGNRALGSTGYGASADYVAQALRDKGFDVQTN